MRYYKILGFDQLYFSYKQWLSGCVLKVVLLTAVRSLFLWQDELREAVLLVFANKQDLPNAMNAAEITDKLGLHSLRQRHW